MWSGAKQLTCLRFKGLLSWHSEKSHLPCSPHMNEIIKAISNPYDLLKVTSIQRRMKMAASERFSSWSDHTPFHVKTFLWCFQPLSLSPRSEDLWHVESVPPGQVLNSSFIASCLWVSSSQLDCKLLTAGSAWHSFYILHPRTVPRPQVLNK